jgi:hypothetical protein
LVTHTGTPANIYDMTTKQRREGIAPPDLGEKFEQNPQFLEACAQVRYRARFADNAGTVVFLSDCESPREELDAAELDEVAKLRGAPATAEAAIRKTTVALTLPAERLEAVVKTDDVAGGVAATSTRPATGVGFELHPRKQVCEQLGCKPATLRNYCEKLGINPDAIKAADFAQIKDYREKRRQRPHLKQFQGPRHGPKPKRRGNKGA